MKNLNNVCEDRTMGLKERILRAAGNKLAEMAASPRGCFFSVMYEPALSPEIIKESAENN